MIADPLAFFLLGPERVPAAESPAWQRFYAHTLAPPFSVPWRFQTTACEPCQARSTVAMTTTTPRWKRTLTLCLNCGFVTAATTHNIMEATSTVLTGGTWAPPDPAVKTLESRSSRPTATGLPTRNGSDTCLGTADRLQKEDGQRHENISMDIGTALGAASRWATLFPHSGEPVPVILTLIFLGWFLIMLLGLAINWPYGPQVVSQSIHSRRC